MPDLFFEDLEPGAVSTFGRHRVDRDEMVDFAREYDSQPFHLDEREAEASPVGTLIASGWYSCAVEMRMLCDAWLGRSASLGGPGIEELRWLRPVVAGDVLSVRQRILDTRVSKSRPGMGLVRFVLELVRADGGTVMQVRHLAMTGLRGHPVREVAPPEPAGVPDAIGPPEDPETAPRFYDDVAVGRGVDLGTYHFTADRITGFARRFDPQGFHLDEAAAAAGPFGGLSASGWQTAAAWMHGYSARLGRLAETGEGRPRIGVSPGFRDLGWLRPVYAGDTIRYATEVVGKRPLGSRPGWGVVTSRNSGRNGRGETVLEFTGSAFWQMRGG